MLRWDKKKFLESIIQIEDEFYILATSTLLDDRTLVSKHDETFAIFDRFGDIQSIGRGEHGIYHDHTRYLSQLLLMIDDHRPLLLSSTMKSDNAMIAVDLTNTDMYLDSRIFLPRGSVHLFRGKFLCHGTCYEYLRIRNYALNPVQLAFTYRFEADFADIFEVRGLKRESRGRFLPPEISEGLVLLKYQGLDHLTRICRLQCSPPPKSTTVSEFYFEPQLKPQQETSILLTISCQTERNCFVPVDYETASKQATAELDQKRKSVARIHTSNEHVDAWIDRSLADIHMMTTNTEWGPYPYAGVPWFSTAFGRDGIITALECLWFYPELARGVLHYLAATQADRIDEKRDAEPGKILHERRGGEMAALGEIPFGLYYGSVDSTPLFVLLAGHYFDRTGDLEFIRKIWSNILRALEWIDRYGDLDGDGFVEYFRKSPKGLINQGWKDSHDSIFHADGTLAEGPIALCEVQAYVYAARRKAAHLARILGDWQRAEKLLLQAHSLRKKFEEVFWCEDISMYALALDGHKKPCGVRSSNAGHTLFTQIANSEKAQKMKEVLLSDLMFSGWGIRTLSSQEVRYNPMSYHNGSIWPHDNALIAYGLSLYDMTEEANRIFEALFHASIGMDLNRLPELFCGFPKRFSDSPILYPVACSPQAWAAASVFLLLQSSLGLSVRGAESQIIFRHPVLPPFLDSMEIFNLRLGDAIVDLHLERFQHDVGIHILRKQGKVEIIGVK